MLRRILLMAVGALPLTSTAALGADIPPPRYTPPPLRAPVYVPVFTWTGGYVGINGGYGFGKSNWTDTITGVTTGDFDVSGGFVGGTLGYNMQFASAIFGLEADFDWASIKGSTATNCVTTCSIELQWLGTVRGRIGYAFDRFLPFVSGGAAFGSIKASLDGIGSTTATNVGWTAGGGVEYAFMTSWTAKVEYLYVDLGKVTCDATCTGGTPAEATFQSHLIRGGVNFKF